MTRKTVNRRLLLSHAGAAETLGISVRKLASLVAEGEVVPVRIGRAVRYLHDDLETYAVSKRST